MPDDDIASQVKAGVIAGFKEVANDKELMEKFWKGGWEELVTHSANASSQWVGRRILTVMVGAIVTAGLIWLVKTGAIK